MQKLQNVINFGFYLRALIVERPSTVSEKWESRGSWVLSSSCCRSLTRRWTTS